MLKKTAVLGAFVLVSCATRQETPPVSFDTIQASSLLGEIRTLASDEFEGRKPGSAGEAKTIAYLEKQFRDMGLTPGNPNGTWLQKVPLAGITSKSKLDFTIKGRKIPLEFRKDYTANSARYTPETPGMDSDIVFVGYGMVAPEYGWDDSKEVHVKGKTILIL